MRFERYLQEERNPKWGYGITFIDIDETTFKTFSKILVVKNGNVVRELDNQEFNTYVLKDGESYDFNQFRDAKFFADTSIPIPKTINMIKNMMRNIEKNESKSRIIFLTARSDFDDKKTFLDTFRKYDINMDSSIVYVERVGNLTSGTIADRKKQTIMKYIKEGIYRRVRLVDDDMKNLEVITDIEKNLPEAINQKVIDTYNLSQDESVTPIQFFALHVDSSGNLKKVN